MTSWVGGIAGGEKYVKEGIFFKFALDGKGTITIFEIYTQFSIYVFIYSKKSI